MNLIRFWNSIRMAVRRILIEDDNSGTGDSARIEEFELPATGDYVIVVAGASRTDAA